MNNLLEAYDHAHIEGELKVLRKTIIKCSSLKFNVTEKEVLELLEEELKVIEPEDVDVLIDITTDSKSLGEVKRAIKLFQRVKGNF